MFKVDLQVYYIVSNYVLWCHWISLSIHVLYCFVTSFLVYKFWITLYVLLYLILYCFRNVKLSWNKSYIKNPHIGVTWSITPEPQYITLIWNDEYLMWKAQHCYSKNTNAHTTCRQFVQFKWNCNHLNFNITHYKTKWLIHLYFPI